MVHRCGRFQPEAVLIFSREFVSNRVLKKEWGLRDGRGGQGQRDAFVNFSFAFSLLNNVLIALHVCNPPSSPSRTGVLPSVRDELVPGL